MEITEAIIPIAFFLTAFGIVYMVISTRHRERMTLIEYGVDAELIRPKKGKHSTLKRGLLALGISFGLAIGYLLDTWLSGEPVVYFICTLFTGGLSLIGSHFLERSLEQRDEQEF